MRTTRRRRTQRIFILGSALGVLGAVAGPPGVAGAGPGTARYATPTGSGTACSQASPCSLTTAINSAPDGADIEIHSGTYGSSASALSTELVDQGHALTIHGLAGPGRPLIYVSANNGIGLTGASSISDIAVNAYSPITGLLLDNPAATADGVLVTSLNVANANACGVWGVMTNSECLATGTNAHGVGLSGSSSSAQTDHVTLRGVTAIGSGGGTSAGLMYTAQSNVTYRLAVTNSIIEGGGHDISAKSAATTGSVHITLDHSEYNSVVRSTSRTSVTKIGTNHNVKAAPKFEDADANEYEEAANSPSINAGASDPVSDSDLDNEPRFIGTAPDIGAYEFPEKPILGTITAAKIGNQAVTVNVPVNPEGMGTDITVRATHGTHPAITSEVVIAPYSRTTETVKVTDGGLAPRTLYSVDVLAESGGGEGVSNAIPVTTSSPPFLGVSIGKGPVKAHHHKVPVHLSCPTSATGTCVGRLTLTRTHHRKAGKASLSIKTGHHAVAHVKLNHKSKKALKKAGHLRFKATVTAHDSSHPTRTTHRHLKVRS